MSKRRLKKGNNKCILRYYNVTTNTNRPGVYSPYFFQTLLSVRQDFIYVSYFCPCLELRRFSDNIRLPEVVVSSVIPDL